MYNLLKNFSRLPMPMLQTLARGAGSLLFTTHSSARRTTELNINAAYPELDDQQKIQLVKASLKSQCMTYVESIKVWGSSPEFALSLS